MHSTGDNSTTLHLRASMPELEVGPLPTNLRALSELLSTGVEINHQISKEIHLMVALRVQLLQRLEEISRRIKELAKT